MSDNVALASALAAQRVHRRDQAVAWRLDNAHAPERDRLWRSYVTGALWGKRGDERRAHDLGCRDAERAVAWTLPVAWS